MDHPDLKGCFNLEGLISKHLLIIPTGIRTLTLQFGKWMPHHWAFKPVRCVLFNTVALQSRLDFPKIRMACCRCVGSITSVCNNWPVCMIYCGRWPANNKIDIGVWPQTVSGMPAARRLRHLNEFRKLLLASHGWPLRPGCTGGVKKGLGSRPNPRLNICKPLRRRRLRERRGFKRKILNYPRKFKSFVRFWRCCNWERKAIHLIESTFLKLKGSRINNKMPAWKHSF